MSEPGIPSKRKRTKLMRYRANPVLFIEEVLINPESGEPFKLLKAEKTFLKYAFKRGRNGRLLYPEQVYACPKKSGKTTFAAIQNLTMVVLFGGPYAEAICAANDYEQSVGRVFAAVKRIIECSPLLRAEAKITADRIMIGDAVIMAIPSNYASAAGSNQVIATFDELWAYDRERSRRLFDELVPPPTRKIACRLTVTYAGFEGESILLKELYDRGLQQAQLAPYLYAGDGMLMFWSHEPVAPWQNETWIADMRRSLRPNQYLFVELPSWDKCVQPQIGHTPSNRGLPIWVGVDASIKRDSTAIVATTWDRNTQQVRLVTHSVFQPNPDEPLNFEATVERVLHDLRQRFNLRKVLFDPWQMQAVAQRLTKAGLRIEEFPQTPANLTAATQNLFELVQAQNLVAYPDAGMRLAISRAVASETPRGWRITKEKQSHRIDVVIALAMAAYATLQGHGESTYNLDAFSSENFNWQSLRTYYYLASGGRVILPGGYNY